MTTHEARARWETARKIRDEAARMAREALADWAKLEKETAK
jgi:hypothetical protein